MSSRAVGPTCQAGQVAASEWNDPQHDWLFTPEAGVDIAVSTGALVARLVQEEVTAGDLVTLLRLRGPGVAVTETALPPGAAVAGLPAGELKLPSGTVSPQWFAKGRC